MAMNFWEAQRRARAKTRNYLLLFMLMIVVVATGLELAMRYYAGSDYDPPAPIFAIGFALLTVGVASFEYWRFKLFGGRHVAESLGGRQVNPHTAQGVERVLLNIVEEMSVAAGVPMPAVYLLDASPINAFAAGLTPNDAVIAVTHGALVKLSRDELQGVIGHEMGHVYNGDMTVGLRLAAMVMGFFFIMYMALRLLQFSQMRTRSDNRGINPILLASLLLFAAGTITWIFGSLLKAAVSRQREYLADASAVQFTRNPDGIAGALRKIINDLPRRDMPASGMAFSHLYFDNHFSISALFATHPPLEKRIAVLEGKAQQ
jgi:heat shock protein HtpX